MPNLFVLPGSGFSLIHYIISIIVENTIKNTSTIQTIAFKFAGGEERGEKSQEKGEKREECDVVILSHIFNRHYQ
jgi:hypothetical protein